MTHGVLTLTSDLGLGYVLGVAALALGSIALLAWELWGRTRGRLPVALSGLVAVVLVALSVLRPATVTSRGGQVGPRIVVLADRSRSMALPGDEGTRSETMKSALARLRAAAGPARLRLLGFGQGKAVPWDPTAHGEPSRLAPRSDLAAALASVADTPEERPSAIVVLSDGRLDRPAVEAPDAETRAALGSLSVPVHTVGLAHRAPRDASIRAVRAAGAAIAHQPLPIRIEIGCEGLACDEVPVAVHEVLDGAPPALLASGTAHIQSGAATVELSVVLERAGVRIVQVSIDSPPDDEVKENDRRLIAFDVGRDRVRLLHVAGRPTYDVRALRMWLKSNASVDLVAFFILRTDASVVKAAEDDLALIRFPVDELFTEHLPSFDAVVLQDFNAATYGLYKHLPALAGYVKRGGGLIMVGGPASFSGGHYAGTPLAGVLPVVLEPSGASTYDLSPAVPAYTDVARAIPVLGPLRAVLGETLPEMVGSNRVGDARDGSFVLFTHPRIRTRSGAPMPLLTLGESGDGRSIALALDATYRLAYSELGSETSGRAHGALWDGLLGWLMRDPRYEPAQVDLVGPCTAGEPFDFAVRPLPGEASAVELTVRRLETREVVFEKSAPAGSPAPIVIAAGALAPGAYSVRARVGSGPAARRDFACERGADEWADSRPDVERLRAIAKATGGRYVPASSAGRIPIPPAVQVSAERYVRPVLPPWVWTVLAAVALGVHWIARRRTGLA
jgi:uncharacterized membrane protein